MCVLASNLFGMKERAEKNVSEWSKKFQEDVQKKISAFCQESFLFGSIKNKLEVIKDKVNNVEVFSSNCENLQNIILEGHKLLLMADSLAISCNDVGIYIRHKEIQKFAEIEKKIFVWQSTLSGQIPFGKRDIFLVGCTVEKDIMCLGNVVLINTDVQGKIVATGDITIINTSGKKLSIAGDIKSASGSVKIIRMDTKNVTALSGVYVLQCNVDGTVRSINKDVYALVQSNTGKIQAQGNIFLDYNSSCNKDKYQGAVSTSGIIYKIY